MERVVLNVESQRCLERARFGEFLLSRSVIDEEQLLEALGDHWAHGGRLGAALVRRGFVSLETVEALADEYHGAQSAGLQEL